MAAKKTTKKGNSRLKINEKKSKTRKTNPKSGSKAKKEHEEPSAMVKSAKATASFLGDSIAKISDAGTIVCVGMIVVSFVGSFLGLGIWGLAGVFIALHLLFRAIRHFSVKENRDKFADKYTEMTESIIPARTQKAA